MSHLKETRRKKERKQIFEKKNREINVKLGIRRELSCERMASNNLDKKRSDKGNVRPRFM